MGEFSGRTNAASPPLPVSSPSHLRQNGRNQSSRILNEIRRWHPQSGQRSRSISVCAGRRPVPPAAIPPVCRRRALPLNRHRNRQGKPELFPLPPRRTSPAGVWGLDFRDRRSRRAESIRQPRAQSLSKPRSGLISSIFRKSGALPPCPTKCVVTSGTSKPWREATRTIQESNSPRNGRGATGSYGPQSQKLGHPTRSANFGAFATADTTLSEIILISAQIRASLTSNDRSKGATSWV